MATDEQIRQRIEELVGEEHRLWEAEARGAAGEGERRRLGELKVTLDQCWDLLRQRRALEEFELDADAAHVRPPRDGREIRAVVTDRLVLGERIAHQAISSVLVVRDATPS